MRFQTKSKRRQSRRFFRRRQEKAAPSPPKERLFRLHPLFLLVGVWYCFKGELFLFLMSCLVAIQHECAHAFAAAKLGYKLNRIVLMPFGAVIDGDLRGLSLKDEIFIALCGPLCNLCTAAFFAALWWFTPDTYAFTDTACYTSLSIALVNLLPAIPLDGGRILRCALTRVFLKRYAQPSKAEKLAFIVCRGISLSLALLALLAFTVTAIKRAPNLSLLPFAAFLFLGAFGNKNNPTAYEKIDYSYSRAIEKGVELRRVAVSERCAIKDALRFVSSGSYLVLEVYDANAEKRFELPQNELDEYFRRAPSPYATLGELRQSQIEK